MELKLREKFVLAHIIAASGKTCLRYELRGRPALPGAQQSDQAWPVTRELSNIFPHRLLRSFQPKNVGLSMIFQYNCVGSWF